MKVPNHLFVGCEGALYDTRNPLWSKSAPLRADYCLGHRDINTVAQFKSTLRNGAYAWPGGYQMYLICSDGAPLCPQCQAEAIEYDSATMEEWEQYTNHGCADHACAHGQITFDSCEAFGDEPQSWNYSGDGYELTDCLDSDIFVLKSPFSTFAQYCSPCVPGAGNLDNAMADGAKTYCLGADWFEEGKAPYPVYSVATGEAILPAA